jgi:uncharacterized protein GlcG (DUF336 family)
MLKTSLFALTILTFAPTAAAWAAPPPPDTARPAQPLADEAARTAVAACAGKGFKTTATVVDAEGEPVAVQSANGDDAAKQASLSKAVTSAEYHTASSDVATRAGTDAILAPAIRDDPKIRVARPGAVPLGVSDQPVGAIGVAGAPDGFKDEACAQAGANKVASRLR